MQRLGLPILMIALGLHVGVSLERQAHATTPEAQLERKREELRHLQKQLTQTHQQLHGHQDQERSLLGTMDRLQQHRENLELAVETTVDELRTMEVQAQTLRREHVRGAQQLQQQHDRLAQRLRQLYKLGRLPYVKLLLSAQDIVEFNRKVHYIRHLAAYDKQQLDRYHEAQMRAETARAELEAAIQRIRLYQDTLQQQQAVLARHRQQTAIFLQRVREEKQLTEQAVAAFTRSAQHLTRVIATLETALKTPAPAHVSKGELSWPVEGPILASYGRSRHPDFDVYTVRKGMYLGAPVGSDIRVAAAGTVVYADRFEGLGRLVIIDHGNHVLTLYGYASAIMVQVGDFVHTQQVVAKVGYSIILGQPALYFAVRHHTVPEDPLLWLQQRSARLTEKP